MRIMVISCQAFSLIQFRMDMMKAFLSEGHEVIAAAPDCNAAEKLLKEIYEPFSLPIVSVKRRSAEMIKFILIRLYM